MHFFSPIYLFGLKGNVGFHTNDVHTVQLFDFGLCRELPENSTEYEDDESAFQMSGAGTFAYMAPEIIVGKGYSYEIDLWSIGIMMYEFMAGELPFGEDLDSPFEIYREIYSKSISFPTYFQDKEAKKLVIQLLNKVPELRLGGSYAILKANRWFSEFDWVYH